MPCTPRSVDGRCNAQKIVYQTGKKRVEVAVGKPVDVVIDGKELIKLFKEVPVENLKKFPEKIHLVMAKEKITVSDITKGEEAIRFVFRIDEMGPKMVKEYDEVVIWMALYSGLYKEEININTFYQMLSRTGFFA